MLKREYTCKSMKIIHRGMSTCETSSYLRISSSITFRLWNYTLNLVCFLGAKTMHVPHCKKLPLFDSKWPMVALIFKVSTFFDRVRLTHSKITLLYYDFVAIILFQVVCFIIYFTLALFQYGIILIYSTIVVTKNISK